MKLLESSSETCRWTPWGIESALTDEVAKRTFQDRANFDYIVLFDDNSYENELKMGHPLFGLKQAIFVVSQSDVFVVIIAIDRF